MLFLEFGEERKNVKDKNIIKQKAYFHSGLSQMTDSSQGRQNKQISDLKTISVQTV